MRATARPQAAEPIDLDAEVVVIHRFLSLVLEPNAPIAHLGFIQTLSLSQLVDMCDCQVLEKRVAKQLGMLAGENPWQALIVASDRDHVELARLTLSGCDPETFMGVGHIGLWENLSALKIEWQIHLLQCLFPGRPTLERLSQVDLLPPTTRSGRKTTAKTPSPWNRQALKWEGTADLVAVAKVFNPLKRRVEWCRTKPFPTSARRKVAFD
ncbi:hypothetical protein DB88DRAFT_470773 [Papiliotrema laurentii]|uniref:Uncharacterized protein n=1 Tax=Papiliotrema laurentii TaxID=5418 RepID=A0AAD9L7H5_PAPLA|nr:hypothetical protein DB88DRAFT_470773 [Papiliotrema laurentii]